jgi:hypothetical protein
LGEVPREDALGGVLGGDVTIGGGGGLYNAILASLAILFLSS